MKCPEQSRSLFWQEVGQESEAGEEMSRGKTIIKEYDDETKESMKEVQNEMLPP